MTFFDKGMSSLRIRAAVGLAGSLLAFWLLHQAMLMIFSEDGTLSEFGSITIGLVSNLWTSVVLVWILTGNFIPPSDNSSPLPGREITTSGRFIGRTLAVLVLSVVWLGAWFYTTLLSDAFRGSLQPDNPMGVSLSETDASKILTEIHGLLSLGILFPLLAASAFIVGWACSSHLRVSVLLIPAGAFCLISAILNYGAAVLATGLPPLYEVMRLLLGGYGHKPTPVEIVLIWFINLALFPLGCWAFAVYARVWTFLGFSLRRVVVVNEPTHSP